MRAQRAIVASAHGGSAELLAGGDAGLLVAPGDAAALANAIRELAADPQRRASLAATARRRYEEAYTEERFVGAMQALFRGLRP
jgi:glycosyltransferase involved in cell wall biosynthesis